MAPDVLIHGDTHRSAALRHELPLGIIDPISYFEVDGRRMVVVSELEAGRIAEAAPGRRDRRSIRARPRRADRQRHALARHRRRAVRAGCGSARGPPPGRAGRSAGGGGRPPARRRRRARGRRARVHPPATLEDAGGDRGRAPRAGRRRRRHGRGGGAAARRRARAAASSSSTARRSPPRRCARAIREVCAELGAPAPEDIIVAAGAAGASGHEQGSGPLPAGVPIIIDLWPRDERSGCWADMTRTFVCGGEPGRGRGRLARALPHGARAGRRAGAGPASPDASCSMPPATSSRRRASRPSARSPRASRCATASSTRSGTASGSRCTRSRRSAALASTRSCRATSWRSSPAAIAAAAACGRDLRPPAADRYRVLTSPS